MPAPTVIGLGELLWDCFPDSRRPGGAPANVAFHASQLGCRGRVASRVGRDADGDELVAFLVRQGLDVSLIQRDSDRPTGRVTVTVSQAGQPTFVIHEDVAWDHLQATTDLLQAVAQCDAVCFGTLAQRSPASRAAIQQCVQRHGPGPLRVFDVNLRQQWYDRAGVEASLRAADLVKLNDAEVLVLADLLDFGDRDQVAFARELRRRYGVQSVVVTRGAEGCLAIRGEEVADVPGQPVQVVDTVGAGDAFTAAFITGTLRGWPLLPTARLANRAGGLVASRAGAMPEIAADVSRLVQELNPTRPRL